MRGSEVVIRNGFQSRGAGGGLVAELAGKGGSLLCRELLVGVGALGMLILHCLAQVRVG